MNQIAEFLSCDIVHPTYVVATRHGFCARKGKHKLSFRPFLLDISIRVTDIPKLLHSVGQGAAHGFWDLSVYKASDQLLATINGRKDASDARVLRPAAPVSDSGASLLDYVAGYTVGTKFLDLPPDYCPKGYDVDAPWTRLGACADAGAGAAPAPVSLGRGASARQAACTREHVSALVRCLSAETADDYTLWTTIGMALKSIGADGSADEADDDLYLDDWIAFSRRGSKFGGADTCRRKWQSFRPNGRLTVGTLCFHAARDDPAAYRAVTHAHKASQAVERSAFVRSSSAASGKAITGASASAAAQGGDEAACAVFLAALKERWPKELGRLQEKSFVVTRDEMVDGVALRFRDDACVPPISGTMSATLVVRLDAPDTFLGLLCGDMPVVALLSNLHRDIPADAQHYVFNQLSDVISTLKSTTADVRAMLTLHHINTIKAMAVVDVPNKRKVTIDGRKKMKALSDTIVAAVPLHLRASLPGAAGTTIFNMFFNNCTIHNYNSGAKAGGDGPPPLTDEELIEAVVKEAGPDGLAHMCYDSLNATWYMWSSATGAWARTSVDHVENFVVKTLGGAAGLSERDVRHVQSRRGRADLRSVLGARLIDDDITKRLDTNLDVFALRGHVVDVRGPTPTMRPTRPDDWVRTYADWVHSVEDAAQHRADVDRFFETVLPVAVERDAFLDEIARLLCGHRYAKRFLVVTDERDGDVGKSTLLALVSVVFADLVLEDNKIVCSGTLERDKNSHDAALLPARGARLLVAEELKSRQTLDTGFLKRVAGGDMTTIGGRGFNTADTFKFVWQAGIVLIFNQNDCPQFDAKDAAFVSRMMVVPMRSKFVAPCDLADDPDLAAEPLTFPMDMGLKRRFPLWRSAVLDILMERFANPMRPVPASMQDWRRSVSQGNNKLSEWLRDNYVVTGNKDDVVLLADVKRRYNDSSVKDFIVLAKAYFKSVDGAAVYDIKRPTRGSQPQKHVVLGVHAADNQRNLTAVQRLRGAASRRSTWCSASTQPTTSAI
jgi:phage/plasmid-associated DNA primase